MSWGMLIVYFLFLLSLHIFFILYLNISASCWSGAGWRWWWYGWRNIYRLCELKILSPREHFMLKVCFGQLSNSTFYWSQGISLCSDRQRYLLDLCIQIPLWRHLPCLQCSHPSLLMIQRIKMIWSVRRLCHACRLRHWFTLVRFLSLHGWILIN